jgi:hypothetical protein
MPVIVAMSMSPAIAAAIIELIALRTATSRFLISLAAVGIFSIHATELITVIVLVCVAMTARSETRGLFNWLWSREPLWVASYSFFMLVPVVVAVGGGAAERSLSYQPVLDLTQTVGSFALFSFSGFAMPIATVLAAVGIIFSYRRQLMVLSVSFLCVGVVCVLAARFPTNSLIVSSTKPWYGQVLRLNYNVVYFAVPLIALALTEIYVFIISAGSRFRILRIAASLLTVSSVSLVALHQNDSATQKLEESWYNGLIPVNQNSIEAFHWMKTNMNSDEYVMTDLDSVDGSTWMYALANVKPIMYGAIANDERDRWRRTKYELIDGVGQLSKRPDLLSWVATHNVKYFYFDERTNAISPEHKVTLEQLRAENELEEVFTLQNAHVFEFKTSVGS